MGILTAVRVKHAKPGEKLADGDGLRLDVDKNGNASWVFRFKSPVTGKERFMGLGPLRDVGLAEAREAASAARALVRNHVDPIEHRISERAKAKAAATGTLTFEAYAKQYIAGKEVGWKNEKHRQQWSNSLRDYAHPIIGQLAVSDIDTEAVLKVLRPIWNVKKETARRVRGRIEAILNAAKAEGLRTGENPALWRGHLDQVLARRRKSDVKHHPALPYEEMPQFWRSLASDTSEAARMLRWIILTACRFNESADMDPAAEVKGELWTIPAIRMKAEREHKVPLTNLALAQLPFRPVSDVTLSNCIARHTNTTATTHGMRSTFRDWAGDCTSFPREIAEMALAHAVDDETEAAYRRSTALAKRRDLMTTWAAYCNGA
ncbi:integrase arm-type DNA-binding domain-containing protein [Bradyrhizobium barranii subsp. barranii]|uniref:Integrase arm-type DNA-binding domain-containing protein n=1 Tax=Bradyrhizobium barranii subsp. barranii TaxID=2823807 RepID=A0A939M7X3_9BRAD|nr:integrase arm-type DNA-binding domain-containing protein [Bradyrhizobium barranii]UEM08446.1 integrase arm-type DNA-binding domain-containing protein [Bradyrhizobium barranii subsp. barranii]